MLYSEIIAVSSGIHTKHINALWGQNSEFVNIKLVVHIVTTPTHWTLKVFVCCESSFKFFPQASDTWYYSLSFDIILPVK
jgi:hypothetical protein